MIKVCHMTSAHKPEDVRIFHKECVSLVKNGYDVTLVEQGDSYEKEGVHIAGIGEVSGGRLKRMLLVSRWVYQRALEVDADIYHFHDPELLPYGLKLKKKGKKVVFDSHEHVAEAILEKPYLYGPLRKLIHVVYSKYQSFVCKRLNAVVTVTPSLTQYFLKITSHVCQITNYPILTELTQLPDYTSNSIFFAGGVTDQWNHLRILRALENLPGCRYCLCGPISESYQAALSAMPAWSNVDYMGNIPHEQVAQEMACCAVGLALAIPSRNSDWKNGSLGNTKIFEEMMAGLPVICTDFVLWKDFVQRYCCGICVDPENVDEIANAIRYLLEHPDEAKRMGENGRRAVREEFNWDVEEKKLVALYDDILKQ